MSKKILKEVWDWALHIALAVAIGLLIIVFLGRLTIVEGNSMNPTLKNEDILIIESITQRFGSLEQGDIVVLKIPELLNGHQKYAIKRIIALENQHVKIADGKVFVDGVPLDEDYINTDTTTADGSLYADMIVPEGCLYVMGDNRIPEKSKDSRTFGAVNEDRVVGRCWIRIFPFSEAGPVD